MAATVAAIGICGVLGSRVAYAIPIRRLAIGKRRQPIQIRVQLPDIAAVLPAGVEVVGAAQAVGGAHVAVVGVAVLDLIALHDVPAAAVVLQAVERVRPTA